MESGDGQYLPGVVVMAVIAWFFAYFGWMKTDDDYPVPLPAWLRPVFRLRQRNWPPGLAFLIFQCWSLFCALVLGGNAALQVAGIPVPPLSANTAFWLLISALLVAIMPVYWTIALVRSVRETPRQKAHHRTRPGLNLRSNAPDIPLQRNPLPLAGFILVIGAFAGIPLWLVTGTGPGRSLGWPLVAVIDAAIVLGALLVCTILLADYTVRFTKETVERRWLLWLAVVYWSDVAPGPLDYPLVHLHTQYAEVRFNLLYFRDRGKIIGLLHERLPQFRRDRRSTPANIEQEVIGFLARSPGINRLRITLPARLDEELGITGYGALGLMASFFRTFDVDDSQFQPLKHVSLGGWERSLWPGSRRLQEGWAPHSGKRVPITVADLVTAARDHKWTL